MHPRILLNLVSCLVLAAGRENRQNFASYDTRQTSDTAGATYEASYPLGLRDSTYKDVQHAFSPADTIRDDPEFRRSSLPQNSPLQPHSAFSNQDECSNEHIVRYWGTVQLPPFNQSQAALLSRPVDSFSFFQPLPQEASMIKELRQYLAYNFPQFDLNRHLSDSDLVRFIRARRGNWEETLKTLSSKEL